MLAIRLARFSGVAGTGAAEGVLRAVAAAVGLFGLSGFALTRLALPDALRRHELLWVMPVGAAASALGLTVLGFAAVPFRVSLGIVLAAGAISGAYAWRRAGPPARPPLPQLAWPAYLAILVACVALIPVFRAGFVTVTGSGSDAVLAAGTAKFLQSNHPTSVAEREPIDQMPLVWRSKQPVYYAFGAVASLAGLETWQTLPVLAAILLALAAIGFYVLSRDVLRAGLLAGCLVLAFVGLDRMVLHTALHPYLNQLWGFFALPWALVLGWAVARGRTRGGLLLLGLFLALGAFAYPLALPIALIPLLAMVSGVRSRIRRPTRRSLLWLVPLGVVFVVPLLGVLEKIVTAIEVIAPGAPLGNWGGDLDTWFPVHQFLFTGSTLALVLLAPVALVAIASELRLLDRRLAAGLAAVLAFGVLCAVYFRLRDVGWYFHFKALAFIAPIAVTLAVAGIARWRDAEHPRALRIAATTVLAGFFVTGYSDTRTEVRTTFDQLPQGFLAVREVDRRLPPGASVRLDMTGSAQLWAGYMLSGQPQCSQRPLFGTNYPHVPVSRKADYVLVDQALVRPADAVGPRVWEGETFDLYRLRADLPGGDRCSRRLVETVTRIQ